MFQALPDKTLSEGFEDYISRMESEEPFASGSRLSACSAGPKARRVVYIGYHVMRAWEEGKRVKQLQYYLEACASSHSVWCVASGHPLLGYRECWICEAFEVTTASTRQQHSRGSKTISDAPIFQLHERLWRPRRSGHLRRAVFPSLGWCLFQCDMDFRCVKYM